MHCISISILCHQVDSTSLAPRHPDSYRALLVVHLTLPRALDPLGRVPQLDEDVGVEDQHHNLIW